MTVAWPESVPYLALQDTFSVDKPWTDPDVTDMDDGTQRAAPSTTVNIATVGFSVRMSAAAYATFKAFARDDLVKGSLPFTMNVWSGSAYVSRKVQMIGATYRQQPDADGRFHNVALSLHVWDY